MSEDTPAPGTPFSSADAARAQQHVPVQVDNNILRHNYVVLDDVQKRQMLAVKDKGLEFITLLHELGGTDPTGARQGSVELSVAQTKLREAVMWAVQHVTAG